MHASATEYPILPGSPFIMTTMFAVSTDMRGVDMAPPAARPTVARRRIRGSVAPRARSADVVASDATAARTRRGDRGMVSLSCYCKKQWLVAREPFELDGAVEYRSVANLTQRSRPACGA